jgi:hypothetical protein
MEALATNPADELTDDQITAFIDDPATIPTHEIALEVVAVLDAEIAQIQSQVDAATIEANVRPLSAERQAWLRRASYAGAMRRNERHRVYQRDKELRGTKNPGNAPKDPNKAEANRLKQARLMEEAQARRINKENERTRLSLAQQELDLKRRDINRQLSFNHQFCEAARRLLPPETYEQVKAAVRELCVDGQAQTSE